MNTAGPDELMPCPLCGLSPSMDESGNGRVTIACTVYGCVNPSLSVIGQHRTYVVAAWNRRTSLAEGAQPEREIEQIIGDIRDLARSIRQACISDSVGRRYNHDLVQIADSLAALAPAAGTRIEGWAVRDAGDWSFQSGEVHALPYVVLLRATLIVHSAAPTGAGSEGKQ